MTRPITRSRGKQIEDSWTSEDDASEGELKKAPESLDDGDASDVETKKARSESLLQAEASDVSDVDKAESPESLDDGDASDVETKKALSDSLLQANASDVDKAEFPDSLDNGDASDVETGKALDESLLQVDASDSERARPLECLDQKKAIPPPSTRQSMRPQTLAKRNKKLEPNDKADEPLESPIQDSIPELSTRRPVYEMTTVTRNKGAEPNLFTPSQSKSITKAASADVDTQIRELQPVRKVATARRRRMVRLAAGVENTIEPRLEKQAAAKRRQPQPTTRPVFHDGIQYVQRFLGEILALAYQVTRTAVWIVSPVIKVSAAVVLAMGFIGIIIWLIFQVFFPFARSVLTASFTSAYSPICHLPGIAVLPLQFCKQANTARRAEPPGATPQTKPIGFDEVLTVQSKLEDVIASSAVRVSLPLDMKMCEGVVREMRLLVEYSSLRSRDKLLLEFNGYIETARMASDGLQRYNSHIDRTYDITLSITLWTTQMLEDVAMEQASKNALQVVNDKMWALLGYPRFTERALRRHYMLHISAVVAEIDRMLIEGRSLLALLENLEARLEDISRIAVSESNQVTVSKAEMLTQLWTILGGNSMEREDLDRRLTLLGKVEQHRKLAYAHVSGTLVQLKEIGTGFEDLRERVQAPGAFGHMSEIPLSVHIETIQRGLKRLNGIRADQKEDKDRRWQEALHLARAGVR